MLKNCAIALVSNLLFENGYGDNLNSVEHDHLIYDGLDIGRKIHFGISIYDDHLAISAITANNDNAFWRLCNLSFNDPDMCNCVIDILTKIESSYYSNIPSDGDICLTTEILEKLAACRAERTEDLV